MADRDDALAETVAPVAGLEATVAATPGLEATVAATPGLEATVASQVGALDATTEAASAAAGDVVVAIGSRLGRYEIVARLGAGAMGVVYHAVDRELGRDVAIKLLRRPDPMLTDRLVREARAMAKVNHPNVVAVYDVGLIDGATYIAMELVRGQSLRAWQLAAPRTLAELVERYLAAGRGLAAAHAAGIIHRDFKPDNVLVGDDGRVRVTDFGLAAAGPSSASAGGAAALEDVELTASGTVMGTPAYMAPEQFAGGNVDPRTDQFNFSVALYEALYGQRPFSGKTFAALCDAVCEGRLTPPPPGARVSAAVRAILLRGLAIRPGDRFATLDYLLAELGRDRAAPWRRAAVAATLVALALGIGVVADTVTRANTLANALDAFAATGDQLAGRFELHCSALTASAEVGRFAPGMNRVIASRDAADFGLATTTDDAAERQLTHDVLASSDWAKWRKIADGAAIAIGDADGRLLYTTASPSTWGDDLRRFPAIAHVVGDREADSTVVTRNDAPAFVASHLLGPTPPRGISLVLAHRISSADRLDGVYVQILDGEQLLHDAGKNAGLAIAMVTLDGAAIGDVPAALVAAAPAPGAPAELAVAGQDYLVETRDLHAQASAETIARVVMARRNERGIAGLFPHARSVFGLAALLMLALAAFTALRARRIAST